MVLPTAIVTKSLISLLFESNAEKVVVKVPWERPSEANEPLFFVAVPLISAPDTYP